MSHHAAIFAITFTDVQAWPGFIAAITSLIVVVFNVYASLRNAQQIHLVKAIVNGSSEAMRMQAIGLQSTIDELRVQMVAQQKTIEALQARALTP